MPLFERRRSMGANSSHRHGFPSSLRSGRVLRYPAWTSALRPAVAALGLSVARQEVSCRALLP